MSFLQYSIPISSNYNTRILSDFGHIVIDLNPYWYYVIIMKIIRMIL